MAGPVMVASCPTPDESAVARCKRPSGATPGTCVCGEIVKFEILRRLLQKMEEDSVAAQLLDVGA